MTNAEAYKLFCKDMIRAISGMHVPGIDLIYGLCSNLREWRGHMSDVSSSIEEYQDELFYSTPTPYEPFNPDGSYRDEREAGTLYQNKARLKWIQDHAV